MAPVQRQNRSDCGRPPIGQRKMHCLVAESLTFRLPLPVFAVAKTGQRSDTNLFVVAEISALTYYCQTLVYSLVVSNYQPVVQFFASQKTAS